MARGTRQVAVVLAVVASLAFLWAAWLILVGGGAINLLGLTLTSNEPLRPFTAGCIALAGFVWIGGRLPSLPHWRPAPRVQVAALSLGVAAFGVVYGTTAATGSDPYGYVSQADLWISGDLHVEQPWVAQTPWPSGASSFAPLGYRPINDAGTLVPTYPSGLALLMAAAKLAAGQEAMFWIVPLSGGLIVLATYGLGRRLAPPGAAVVAAWLMATCPALLYMLVQPMSDVPVAAAWMGAAYLLLRRTVPTAAVAGLAAAAGVMIRPNLAFLAVVFAAWPLWHAHVGNERRRALTRALAFGGCASLGVVAVLLINRHLYGSALAFGHGDPAVLFGLSNFLPNLARYFTWLVQSHTIVAGAGALALLVPLQRVWPDEGQRRCIPSVAVALGSVWLFYCFYLVFDEWWYLRFMLPVLPFITIATGAVVVALRNAGGRTAALTAIGLVLVVMTQYRFAASHGVTDFWRAERRYVGAARLMAQHTPPDSVVFSLQHSGSVRYYGGRVTIRFDNMERQSLDQAVQWLASRGVRAYLLAEAWEIPMFRERFAGQATLAMLEAPLAILTDERHPATLFDLNQRPSGPVLEIPNPAEGLRSVPPAPGPTLR